MFQLHPNLLRSLHFSTILLQRRLLQRGQHNQQQHCIPFLISDLTINTPAFLPIYPHCLVASLTQLFIQNSSGSRYLNDKVEAGVENGLKLSTNNSGRFSCATLTQQQIGNDGTEQHQLDVGNQIVADPVFGQNCKGRSSLFTKNNATQVSNCNFLAININIKN